MEKRTSCVFPLQFEEQLAEEKSIFERKFGCEFQDLRRLNDFVILQLTM